MMDKSWMECTRDDTRYMQGIEDFLRFVVEMGQGNTVYACACKKCRLRYNLPLADLKKHLFWHGIMTSYTTWYKHGEVRVIPSLFDQRERAAIIQPSSDPVINMLNATFPYPARFEANGYDDYVLGNGVLDRIVEDDDDHEKYKRLLEAAQRPLYPGCKKTLLGTIVKFMEMKAQNGLSNKAADDLCEYIKDLMPEDNIYPTSHYHIKRLLKDIGLDYVKIHACEYNCVVFYKEYADLDKCPVCDESRWKDHSDVDKNKRGRATRDTSASSTKKLVPKKVIWHFPLVPRLKRLFMSAHTAKAMRWHGEREKDSEFLKHPSDGEAWEHFDKEYPDFAADVRNVRLGLSTDGFNPFGHMSVSHSTWPVIVMPYNLPPWMCMKKEFNMLSLLIPGPSSPGKCLDVYMRVLIDELKELWSNGVPTFDYVSQSTFRMRAALMWTISDFPAYGMLSSLSVKGYRACPLCLNQLSAGYAASRMCYKSHRRWLPHDHKWRYDKDDFDGTIELGEAPRTWGGDALLDLMEYGEYDPLSTHPKFKRQNSSTTKRCWDHKSIFFELPYWSSLLIRHNLDVMHIEKNVCDNIIGTVLGLENKSKDGLKAREAWRKMNVHKNLWLKMVRDKWVIPHAPYTVKPDGKKKIFQHMSMAKYPYGYAGNIRRNVKVGENKIYGLKTHDSHVLLQRLLPVIIRPYLPVYVVDPLIALSRFFQKLCARELKKTEVRGLQEDIVFILCKFERIFPPPFFSIMMHLTIHLPAQALLSGPVHYNWMFPIERQLGDYKRFVRTMSNPEGSIAEQYIAHECVTYCSLYLGGDSVDTNMSYGPRFKLSVYSHLVRVVGAPSALLNRQQIKEAHWSVLDYCDEVEYFKKHHKKAIKSECIRKKIPNWKEKHKEKFPSYLQKWMLDLLERGDSAYNGEVHLLSVGPQSHSMYSQCVVNGVKFVCHARDQKFVTQNSGVMVEGVSVTYYGVLEAVVELLYPERMPVVLFKCKWFNTDPTVRGSTMMDHGLLSVNTATSWYEDDPYVLATMARQVFYIDDPKAGGEWKVVNPMTHRGIFNETTMKEIVENQPDIRGNQVEEPYQETTMHDIPETSSIREYIPITSMFIDVGNTSIPHEVCEEGNEESEEDEEDEEASDRDEEDLDEDHEEYED